MNKKKNDNYERFTNLSLVLILLNENQNKKEKEGMFYYLIKNFMIVILSFFLVFSSFARSQGSFERDYLILKKIPADYKSFGSICEQVARLRLKEKYNPKKFNFLVGLEYRNSNRVLGEVDLVVFYL